MKELDDLLPIGLYSKDNQLTPKDVIGLGLMGKLDVFYVFDGPSLVIYEPVSDHYKTYGTKNNMVADEGCIEIEYLPNDVLPITKLPLNLLYTNDQTELISLIEGNTPEGFALGQMLDGSKRVVDINKLLVDPDSVRKESSLSAAQDVGELVDKPTKTSLKVIGLLMMHLAKSPKYASGNTPNKSQIKELLLELAAEFEIKEYGLSKVDERLLVDAMKYLEDQKS